MFVLSLNSTVPTGYDAQNSRKIGGFHCLCASVGTISGHTLSGYAAGDILPLSVWDLLHRPVSEPEGMVWIEGLGIWVDIYLGSYNGSKLVSAYGALTADGSSSPAFHGEKFAEYAGLVGKRLVRRDEFIVFAKGSNEETSISGGRRSEHDRRARGYGWPQNDFELRHRGLLRGVVAMDFGCV